MYLVKKNMLVAVVGCFFTLVSCSGSSGSSFVPQEEETANKSTEKITSDDYDDDIAEEKVITYENESDVPECTWKKNGAEVYVVDVAQYRVCLKEEWLIKRDGRLEKISSSSTALTPSSAEPLVLSSVSELSPLDAGSQIIVDVQADGKGSYVLVLSGIIKTDSDEFETEGYVGNDRVYYVIDKLQFDVADKNGNRVSLPVALKPGVSLGKENINLVSVIDDIPLDYYVTCGDKFTLYVTVFMSGDEESTKQYAYTARLSDEFSIPCKVIESSSTAYTCTEMERVGPVTLSNKIGDGQYAINFATGTADNPDVTMVIEDGEAFFDAGAGVEIVRESSQELGVIPEGKVCQEQFSEAYNGMDNHMELEQMGWYLIKTASGTYAVMVDSFMRRDDTKGDLTIIYFRRK